MAAFDDKAVIEFLRRSYFAVDGLWFVRTEEDRSYDEAMKLDEQVWEVMPKIQARKAKELLKIEGGSLADLALGLWLKFAAEGYAYQVAGRTQSVLRIHVYDCPWLQILRKSGRMSKASDICNRICAREAEIWAKQFSEDIDFSLEAKLPDGAPVCELLFTRPKDVETAPSPEMEAAG